MAIIEQDVHEKRILKVSVTAVCALFDSNKECTYHDCETALKILKAQYNLVDIDIEIAMHEAKLRRDRDETGNGKAEDKMFSNPKTMANALCCLKIQRNIPIVLKTLKEIHG